MTSLTELADEFETIPVKARYRPQLVRAIGELRAHAAGASAEAVPEADVGDQMAYRLTRPQARLLAVLKRHAGKCVRRLSLWDALYFDDPDPPEIKNIDVFICKLRQKLKTSPYRIETIRGAGYILKVERGP